MARWITFVLCITALLAACASNPKPTVAVSPAGGPSQISAVPAPESNLYRNRMGSHIPPVLVRAMEEGYARPYPDDCAGLLGEVQALDAVLGEDIDSRSGEPIDEKFFASVMASAIKGLIPYRSWLIRLSGEGSRARRGIAAIAAGSIRRAYLKGLGESWDCVLPGRPKRPGIEILAGD